jgi:hypothetical protein
LALQLFQVCRLAFLFPALRETSCDAIGSGTEGVIAKIEAFAHQEFNNDGATMFSNEDVDVAITLR